MKLVVNKSKCTGCRFCMLVCSLHHGGVCGQDQSRIWIDRSSLKLDVPHIRKECDFCGGDPLCVKYCPFDAIEVK